MASARRNNLRETDLKNRGLILYRFSQFISLLLGARIFVLMFFAFTLYVSTFFLFNQEETFRSFVFDYKVHGIILCSLLSMAAGGIINQFYDQAKDRIQKPFRTRIQNFLKQRYFLYTYLFLNVLSLSVAWLLSPRIFIFFLVYQFMIWFYSHRLSRILVVNNVAFVILSLYPFFGLLVYYRHFSLKLLLMAAFLFAVLLIIDVLKDILTVRPDKIFGYHTVPNSLGIKPAISAAIGMLVFSSLISCAIVWRIPHFNYLVMYYSASAIVLLLACYPLLFFRLKHVFWLMNLLRFWLFVGVVFMLLNGIFERFSS